MAIICFLLGGLGIHNFMMGENKKGIVKLWQAFASASVTFLLSLILLRFLQTAMLLTPRSCSKWIYGSKNFCRNYFSLFCSVSVIWFHLLPVSDAYGGIFSVYNAPVAVLHGRFCVRYILILQVRFIFIRCFGRFRLWEYIFWSATE